MINIPNSTKQNSNQSADRFKAHWLLTLGLLWLFVSNVAAQCPDLGPRKTVASSFHSSLIIDSADIVRYWGDAINQDGSAADVLSPLTLTGYTGSPLAVAASSISGTNHQHYLLTTTNLYGWGHSARTINTAVITDVALTTIALPAGVLIGDINFIRASNGGVALVTNSGHVWIKAGNNSICTLKSVMQGIVNFKINVYVI